MKTQSKKQSQEELNEQTKQNSNYELIKEEKIKNTPFKIVYIEDEDKAFIVWGKYRVSKIYKIDSIELKHKINNLEEEKTDWELIQAIAGTIALETINQLQTINEE